LASISVGNDFVSLARGTAEEKRRKRKCFGVSTETNQWLIDLYLAMMAAVAALGRAKNVMRELFDNDPSQLRPEWGSGRRRAIATIVDGISKEKGATASAGVLAFAGSIRGDSQTQPESSQSKHLHGPDHGRENNASPVAGRTDARREKS
jgi:hypothetical protein